MRLLRTAFIVLLTATPTFAASTRFVSTWINPKGGFIDRSNQKVAAFVVSPDPGIRLGPEESLAAEMRDRGLDCVAGYTVLPVELAKDQEKAKEFLKKAGITAAVLFRLVAREERTSYTPPTVWYTTGPYSSFWNYWGYGWTTVYEPGYLTRSKVWSIETLVFSIDRDILLWAGQSETTNPKDVRKFVKELVGAVGMEMRRAGLVTK